MAWRSGDSDARGVAGDNSRSCALRRSNLDNVGPLLRRSSSGLGASCAIRKGDGAAKRWRREDLVVGRVGVSGDIGGGVSAPCRFRMLFDVVDTRRSLDIRRSSCDSEPGDGLDFVPSPKDEDSVVVTVVASFCLRACLSFGFDVD